MLCLLHLQSSNQYMTICGPKKMMCKNHRVLYIQLLNIVCAGYICENLVEIFVSAQATNNTCTSYQKKMMCKIHTAL